jgi:hypothetical protein
VEFSDIYRANVLSTMFSDAGTPIATNDTIAWATGQTNFWMADTSLPVNGDVADMYLDPTTSAWPKNTPMAAAALM